MALTVEDGSGIPGAESYVDVAVLQAFAAARGYSLPADVATLEQVLRLGTEFIETYWKQFKGDRKADPVDQGLQWPRINVVIDGFTVSDTTMPVPLLNATAHAAYEITLGNEPLPSSIGRLVKFTKIGPIEKEFFGGDSVAPQARLRRVEAFLEPILTRSGLAIASQRI